MMPSRKACQVEGSTKEEAGLQVRPKEGDAGAEGL